MATQLSRKRRSRDNKLTELLWEPNDAYTLTSEDIARGWFEHQLIHPRIVYRLLVRCRVNAGEYPFSSMIVNEDTGLVHVTLGGWETVDEDVKFQYYYRFGGRLVPAPEDPVDLLPALVYQEFSLQAAGAPIWNDSSDATSTYTRAHSGTDIACFGWLEEFLNSPSGVTAIELFGRIDPQTDEGAGSFPVILSICGGTGGGAGTLTSTDVIKYATFSTGLQDFSVTLDATDYANTGTNMLDLAAHLARDDGKQRCIRFELGGGAIIPPPASTRTVTVYEAGVRLIRGG